MLISAFCADSRMPSIMSLLVYRWDRYGTHFSCGIVLGHIRETLSHLRIAMGLVWDRPGIALFMRWGDRAHLLCVSRGRGLCGDVPRKSKQPTPTEPSPIVSNSFNPQTWGCIVASAG